MRVLFNQEIEELLKKFNQMAALVDEAIYDSVKSFVNHDKDLAKKVIDNDYKINDLEKEIDVECTGLIALQQPNTSDLRKIMMILTASSDLERMADHAVSISQATIRLKGSKRSNRTEKLLSDMSEIIKWMVQQITVALTNFDMEHAMDVASRDDEIDNYDHEIRKIATERMESNPDVVSGGMDYVLVSSYIERIGDYVTNLAECLVYLETGENRELN